MAEQIDLSPQVLDLKLYSGDGVRFRVIVTDKNNDPVPLTGTMEAQIRDKRGETDTAEAEFSVDLTDAADGIAVFSLTGEQTRALTDQNEKTFKGVWDCQWTPSGSEPRTFCQGKVECDVDVTR